MQLRARRYSSPSSYGSKCESCKNPTVFVFMTLDTPEHPTPPVYRCPPTENPTPCSHLPCPGPCGSTTNSYGYKSVTHSDISSHGQKQAKSRILLILKRIGKTKKHQLEVYSSLQVIGSSSWPNPPLLEHTPSHRLPWSTKESRALSPGCASACRCKITESQLACPFSAFIRHNHVAMFSSIACLLAHNFWMQNLSNFSEKLHSF